LITLSLWLADGVRRVVLLGQRKDARVASARRQSPGLYGRGHRPEASGPISGSDREAHDLPNTRGILGQLFLDQEWGSDSTFVLFFDGSDKPPVGHRF
jgi:hypothetical protein